MLYFSYNIHWEHAEATLLSIFTTRWTASLHLFKSVSSLGCLLCTVWKADMIFSAAPPTDSLWVVIYKQKNIIIWMIFKFLEVNYIYI